MAHRRAAPTMPAALREIGTARRPVVLVSLSPASPLQFMKQSKQRCVTPTRQVSCHHTPLPRDRKAHPEYVPTLLIDLVRSITHHQIASARAMARGATKGLAMLDNRVVLITGASAGIGAALARVYANRRARVVMAARRLSRIEEIALEIRRTGVDALAVECDVTRDGDVERAVAETVDRWGRLDTLVANAGFGVSGKLQDLALEDYRRQFETNVFGVIRTIQAGLSQVLEQRGRIAIVGSVAGFIASPGVSPYCMSKFAVRALAQSLRLELKPLGVSVTHLAPGFVDSEIRLKKNDESLPPDARDPVPSWLVMDSLKAARQMFHAIERRRRERIITAHGKVIVFLSRHAHWLLDLAAGNRRGLGSTD